MPLAAEDRDRVWKYVEEKPYLLSGDTWVDFYALLRVERDASPAVLEEAIIERGADILTLSFARGVPERLRVLAHYLPDLRLVLLHAPTRASYDEQLRLHELGFVGALPYEIWSRASINRLARLKHHSASRFKRLMVNLWENEYI